MLVMVSENEYSLTFDYTLDNQAEGNIQFLCLYNNTDNMMEINLTDKDNSELVLGNRPLEELTLTEPKPLLIPIGKTTRQYTVPVMSELREKDDIINIRARLHVPSRYDELRSSIEARWSHALWP